MVDRGRVEVDENDQPETVELYIEIGAIGTPRDGSVKQWKGMSQGTVFVPLVAHLDNSLLRPFLFFPALNAALEEAEKKGGRERTSEMERNKNWSSDPISNLYVYFLNQADIGQ